MTTAQAILALLTLAALGSTVFWSAVLIEMVWLLLHLPTARSGIALAKTLDPAAAPSVCLIIPAYNEAASIATVARSLMAQDYPRLHVVFALDRCTDATDSILRSVIGADPRFTIFPITSCPADWSGKVHAVWRAASDSAPARAAEILTFADADVEFDPACIGACAALLRTRNLGLLSLLSSLSNEHWFEKVVQPVAGYELMRQFPPRRVNRGQNRRPLANGQFMMFTRGAYDSFGGHGNPQVKDELLEDIALAKRVKWEGFDANVLPAAGMLTVRMYESYGQFAEGWRRIFSELAHRRPRRLRSYALQLFVTDVFLPLISLAGFAYAALTLIDLPGERGRGEPATLWIALAALLAGFLGFALMHLVVALGCRWARAPLSITWLHFPGSIAVVHILLRAARDLELRRPVRWGGRMYQREPRYEGDEKFPRTLLGFRAPGAASH
ncbi:hypothetical protein BH11PLA1_BH11PLA1_12320 [soil metagenome]